MNTNTITVKDSNDEEISVPLFQHHTLVIGSGAAGLNAAVQLRAGGVEDVTIVTEGLQMGTSINTGSDKQTYYKLSMYGDDTDSPALMAESYFKGGSMHGDLAMVEAGLSARAFLNLVNLGVPFPTDEYGQFIGYKTDHDPRQRATSIGPYTSREMCRALIRQVKYLNIPVKENRTVVRLIVMEEDSAKRVCGAVLMNSDSKLEVYIADNVVLAVGGPGGLYKTSVYPSVHTGAIGLGLMAGATAQNLPESQYGMASIKFRWNVSGTYMQVIPRFISTAEDGSDEREFLLEYFDSVGDMNSQIFLKGYQWPFDSRKVIGGSSIVDILVYIESVSRGRRVFMDFTKNPDGFSFEDLSNEAREYLTNSNALLDTPIERLRHMNPGAIALYKDNDIDISKEPLEIAVCAQHNNGGLATNHWWESLNIKHLFPVGEVNGSHGVYRPGGSALNSGQVASIRAAEFIANRYAKPELSSDAVKDIVKKELADIISWSAKSSNAPTSWQEERAELQSRMTKAGAHIRSVKELESATQEAWKQYKKLSNAGCSASEEERKEPLKNLYLCFAHAAYLEAVLFALKSGVGSRGSAIALDPTGKHVHEKLDKTWCIAEENESFREQVMETTATADGTVTSNWVPRRPMPAMDAWFETAWARYREGLIYE